MKKPDKKNAGADAPDTQDASDVAIDVTDIETPAEAVAQSTGEDTPSEVAPSDEAPSEAASVAVVVDKVPDSAMTASSLTKTEALEKKVAQYEAGLLELESQVFELGDKYPQYADALADIMSRYGQSSVDEAIDVSVRAPATYIKLRHGMSKNVPKELKIDIGEFFTHDRNLGPSFDALLLYLHEARKYFPKGSVELKAPECQSHDAKFGSKYGDCSTCEHAKYDAAKGYSDCSRGYAAMLASPDFQLVGELAFMKTAAAGGRKFAQNLQTMKGGSSQWITEVTTREHESSAGHKNAVPVGGLPKTRTTDEQREVLVVLAKFFKLRAHTFSAKNELRRVSRELSFGDEAGAGAGALGAGADAGPAETVPLL